VYIWDQQSVFLQVYRFDGEIAVPAALLCKDGSGVHPRIGNRSSNDSGDMWMWQDTNRDGQFDPDEYTGYRADNPYAFGWFVDRDGNVWKGMRESGIRKLTLRVDGNGMPTYSPIDVVENPVPFAAAVSGDIRRVHYDAASDTIYVTGYNSSNTQGGSTGNDDRGAGRLMAGDLPQRLNTLYPPRFTRDARSEPEVLRSGRSSGPVGRRGLPNRLPAFAVPRSCASDRSARGGA